MWLNCLPFYGWIVFHCMCRPHFVYPSSISGHLGCFHLSAVANSTAMNVGVQISLQDPSFNSFGYISRNGIARSYGNSIFNFLRRCHTLFRNSCALLHSHWQCTRAPVSPHLCQHLLFSSLSFFLFSLSLSLSPFLPSFSFFLLW